jgi:hypothetical protein
MNIIRTLAAPAFALTLGLGTVLAVTPSFASKDRVEHQDRQDKQDRQDRGDHNKDKSGDHNKDDKGDKGDDNGGDH